MSKTELTQSELETLQEKIVREGWLPTSEHFSLHIYESRWDIDGLKLILDNIKDSYVCDCERNYGKACKYPDRYKNEGCND